MKADGRQGWTGPMAGKAGRADTAVHAHSISLLQPRIPRTRSRRRFRYGLHLVYTWLAIIPGTRWRRVITSGLGWRQRGLGLALPRFPDTTTEATTPRRHTPASCPRLAVPSLFIRNKMESDQLFALIIMLVCHKIKNESSYLLSQVKIGCVERASDVLL